MNGASGQPIRQTHRPASQRSMTPQHHSAAAQPLQDWLLSAWGHPTSTWALLQVGSASGNSAAVWGAELRQNEGVLVAFDTWGGDLDMWLSESFRDVMGWQARFPALSGQLADAMASCGSSHRMGMSLVYCLCHQCCTAALSAPGIESAQRSPLGTLDPVPAPTGGPHEMRPAQQCALQHLIITAALQDGHSHLYERFLNRMVKEGLTGTVLPVRTTAPVGARMMGVLNYTVDAIYLDAAQVRSAACSGSCTTFGGCCCCCSAGPLQRWSVPGA